MTPSVRHGRGNRSRRSPAGPPVASISAWDPVVEPVVWLEAVSMGTENVTLLGIENVTLRGVARGGSGTTGAGRAAGSWAVIPTLDFQVHARGPARRQEVSESIAPCNLVTEAHTCVRCECPTASRDPDSVPELGIQASALPVVWGNDCGATLPQMFDAARGPIPSRRKADGRAAVGHVGVEENPCADAPLVYCAFVHREPAALALDAIHARPFVSIGRHRSAGHPQPCRSESGIPNVRQRIRARSIGPRGYRRRLHP